MKKVTLHLLLSLMPLLAFSQEKWEGGLFVGYSNYLGDLVEPEFTFDQANFAGGIFLRNHLSNTFGLRANLNYGKIEGDDANYDRNLQRGASFESSFLEFTLMGEYEFFGNRRWSENGSFNKIISPYIFGGLGVGFFDPSVDFAEERPTNDLDLNADYSNTHLAVPVGGGIKMDLSRKVNLGIEFGLHFTFSDYLDGISETGDPDDNDVIPMGGIALGFRLGESDQDNDGVADEKDKCPTIAGPIALGGCPDTDGDGLADRDDSCPEAAGEIRLNGCPDRDGDGIADNVDDCPDDVGLRRFSGCPDTDKDNIVDKEDNCPTVPGLPAMNGCPDADRDGIADADDACPNAPGTAEFKGCPDTDNDGIADSEDICPETFGLSKFNGCPDTDNDGIADNTDKCPTLAGPSSNDGCPEITEEDQATLDFAMRNVQFRSGSNQLLSSSKAILDQVAEVLSRYPGYKLEMHGYTDNVGNDFANQQLSESRARACMDYLASKGVDRSLMTIEGHGENSPIADNSTASGRQLNRRVEFKVIPQ